MKQLFLKAVLCLLLAAVAASATPICTNGTLNTYIGYGSGGCTLGNLLFSNFNYTYTLGTDSHYVSGFKGAGNAQASAIVSVSVDAINEKLDFGGNWVVTHYQTASLSLTFTVSAPSGPVATLQNQFIETANGSQNGGPSYSPSATCSLGTCGPTTFTNSIIGVSSTSGPITISNTVTMNSNGGSLASQNRVHLSIIEDQFKTTSPPTTVPEPMPYLLSGLGFGALALLRRRKQV